MQDETALRSEESWRRFFLWKKMETKNIREVFLAESVGYVSACEVKSSAARKIVLSKGQMIGPREISGLAALGIDRISVYDKPRIAIIVIGKGLISPGMTAPPGKTYDFGSPSLKAALDLMRIRPVLVRRVPDETKALKKVIPFALGHSDIIILVSKEIGEGIGRARQYLESILGGETQKPVFCLPYDKDLLFENFEKFVQPAILNFMGVVSPKKAYVE